MNRHAMLFWSITLGLVSLPNAVAFIADDPGLRLPVATVLGAVVVLGVMVWAIVETHITLRHVPAWDEIVADLEEIRDRVPTDELRATVDSIIQDVYEIKS